MRTHYFTEQRDRARMRHQGRGLVEAGAFRRSKGVIAAGIEIELDLGAPLESALDLLARLGRRVLVELGEMKDHRHLDIAGFGNIGLDADTVIADGAIHIRARGDEISKLTAETEAERPDLAFAFRPRA